jgi:hypothetical protein
MLHAKWVAMFGVAVAPALAAAAYFLFYRRRDGGASDAERIANAGRLIAGGGVRRIT